MLASTRHTLLLVVAAAMLITSCSSQPEIFRAQSSGHGTTLHFEMNACHGDYAVTISEDLEEVRVSITDQRRRTPFSGGDDCGDVVGPVVLEGPLADRRLIDTSHGVEVSVLFTPWNQSRYSAADYLAAVEATAQCVKNMEPEATVSIVTNQDGHPDLRVNLPELGDGESQQINPETVCVEQHIDPLRH